MFIGRLKAKSGKESILPFQYFLCAPLLVIGGNYEYKKYCGNATACSNSDEVSEILSAFNHHVYVESVGTIIFADFQGMSKFSFT